MNQGQVKDEKKNQLVNFIDIVAAKFPEKCLFTIELNRMKKRYIFKDIAVDEYKKDVQYLKNVKEILQGS
jgi:hypothetical protein